MMVFERDRVRNARENHRICEDAFDFRVTNSTHANYHSNVIYP